MVRCTGDASVAYAPRWRCSVEERRVAYEMRAAESEGNRVLTGYAVMFNALSEQLGNFREEVAPGAFKGVIDGDTRALFNHDPNYVLGRTTNGTLRLVEDERGLRVEIVMPSTAYAQDLWTLVQRGDVNQMSFGFTVGEDGQEWRRTATGPVRRVTKVQRLLDVSPVTYPAYPQTSIEARNAATTLASDENEVSVPKHVNDTSDEDAVLTQAERRNRTLKLIQVKR